MNPVSTYEELEKVLGYYALGRLRAIQRVEKGFINDNWVITTDQGCFFLKRRHPQLRRSDIIFAQHELVRWLWQRGFPAPKVIPTIAGKTLLDLAGQFYEIQEYIPGQSYNHNHPAHLDEAARTLARYHAEVQGFSPQVLRDLGELYSPLILKKVLADLVQAWNINEDQEPMSLVRRLDAHAEDLVERFSRNGLLPFLIIHGDYYADNLLFKGDRIVGVVDYDKVRWQPRVVELAEALIYFASPQSGHLRHIVYSGFLHREPLWRFLRHYVHVAAIEETELQALPDYVRCIWLQMSLTRLLEKGPPIAPVQHTLEEVVALADWAQVNASSMIEPVRASTFARFS